jgi:hypothetical protein
MKLGFKNGSPRGIGYLALFDYFEKVSALLWRRGPRIFKNPDSDLLWDTEVGRAIGERMSVLQSEIEGTGG